MTLITVLISLFLERVVGYLDDIRHLEWFHRYTTWLRQRLGSWGEGAIGVALVLLPPIVLVWLVEGWIDDVMLGLLEIIFGVVVLIYCLGPKDLETEVESFIEAGAMEDEDRLYRTAADLVGGEVPAEPAGRVQAVAESIFVEANRRIFAVLFWFIAFGFMGLGPLGAVAYRLSSDLGRHGEGEGTFAEMARRWVDLLEWVPARLTAIAYALAGHFDDTLPVLKQYLFKGVGPAGENNTELLKQAGAQSVSLEQGLSPEIDATAISVLLGTATNLLLRTVVVWVVVLALLTIAGWAS